MKNTGLFKCDCHVADASLDHAANSGQSENNPFCALQFTNPQWHLFWRLLVVGCIMSDHLMKAADRFQAVSRDAAELWDELSMQFATHLQGDVVIYQEKESKTNH